MKTLKEDPRIIALLRAELNPVIAIAIEAIVDHLETKADDSDLKSVAKAVEQIRRPMLTSPWQVMKRAIELIEHNSDHFFDNRLVEYLVGTLKDNSSVTCWSCSPLAGDCPRLDSPKEVMDRAIELIEQNGRFFQDHFLQYSLSILKRCNTENWGIPPVLKGGAR